MNFKKMTRHSFHITIYFLSSLVLCFSADIHDNPDYATFAVSLSKDWGKPLITPIERDLTFLPGADATLICQSKEPIEWIPFEGFEGINNTEYKYSPDDPLPYRGILQLINIDYTYVGYFHCVKTESIVNREELDLYGLEEEFKSSKIYIFVDDPKNPLVPTYNPIIHGIVYSQATIPCKPTSKSIEVQLFFHDEEIKSEAKYDPTTGFKIRIDGLTQGGDYFCKSPNYPDAIEMFSLAPEVRQGYVSRPSIISKHGHYATEGDVLELVCKVDSNQSRVKVSWILPSNNSRQEGRFYEPSPSKDDEGFVYSKITISNLRKETDSGEYICQVEDSFTNKNHDIIPIKILGKGQGEIELREPTGSHTIKVKANIPEIKWKVEYKGHPKPHLEWYDPENRVIPTSSTDGKFRVDTREKEIFLIIKSPQLSDAGNYTLKAHNDLIEETQQFELTVEDKPVVMIEDVFVKPGDIIDLVCNCSGYPPSEIKWTFKPCSITPHWPTCDEKSIQQFSDKDGSLIRTEPLTSIGQRSVLSFRPTQPGLATCSARNLRGEDQQTANVYFSELEHELQILGIGDDPIADGDQVEINCGASAFKYSGDLRWTYNGKPMEQSDVIKITSSSSQYTYYSKLSWKSINHQANGRYECLANVISNDSPTSVGVDLIVHNPEKPEVELVNIDDSSINLGLGDPLRLTCRFKGIPKPAVVWYKDNVEFEPSTNDTRVKVHNVAGDKVIDIKFMNIEHEGDYKCEATSRLGNDSKAVSIAISNLPSVSKGLILGVIALILILTSCLICLCFRVKRARRLLRELKAAGLANFNEGNPDGLNPELALDEQADLLPYDAKFEFPREKLKLGKHIGAGAFGVVVRAIAQNILPYEEETIVAVKMIKPTADNEVIRALISELKIMVHLGQHLNVVNLLGAVTKNISNREVMVIVEYCRFGNLQNFLLKNRDHFVDQIIRDKDVIDPTILTKEQRWSKDSGYEYYNRKSTSPPPASGYMRHSDYFPGGMDSANTEASLLSRTTQGGEDNFALSNNSVQPAWRSNYRSDYKGPARTITTSDLLCWSFQVARGMQYLSSRKVLHGDLAARNILLCDDNVVKICDFGLARSMYKNDNYKKKGECPLPFKWLAIESIGEQIFSTYSDVWSFGVVMWELFTLGKVPYPGMNADQSLYFKLKDGYRMEKPEFATQEIYDIMLHCWSANPDSRPLFDNLEKKLGKLLENGVAEHYLDLNEPYMQMNADNYKDGQTDYLAILGTPEYPAPPVPPTYINGHILPPEDNTRKPDYLTMSPTDTNNHQNMNELPHFQFSSIDSPTTTNNLNASPSSRIRVKNPVIPEEIPMLKRSNQSLHTDSETEHNSLDVTDSANKYPTNSVSVVKPQPRDIKKNMNVLNASTDNYVNVPPTIINIDKPKDAVSNPSYIMVGNINETKT